MIPPVYNQSIQALDVVSAMKANLRTKSDKAILWNSLAGKYNFKSFIFVDVNDN